MANACGLGTMLVAVGFLRHMATPKSYRPTGNCEGGGCRSPLFPHLATSEHLFCFTHHEESSCSTAHAFPHANFSQPWSFLWCPSLKAVVLVNSLITEPPASSSTQLLTIHGHSRVGKSSLVMAGFLPKLQQGALPGSKKWVFLVVEEF